MPLIPEVREILSGTVASFRGNAPEEVLAYWRDPLGEYVFFRGADGNLYLTINGGLQFSTLDERRYHEALFGLPALLEPVQGEGPVRAKPKDRPLQVLVCGGGDGLGVRTLLELERRGMISLAGITLVDISEYMLFFASTHPVMRALNGESLRHPLVRVEVGDAHAYLASKGERFDLIVLDYPDPSLEPSDQVNRLFTVEHYRMVRARLAPGGIVSVQATSVWHSPNVFRKVMLTLQEAGFGLLLPLRLPMPSMGDVGIIYASETGERFVFAAEPTGTFVREGARFAALTAFLADELPTLPDEELARIPIWGVVGYDLRVRRMAVSEPGRFGVGCSVALQERPFASGTAGNG
ncbi:spermidine synthase [Thermosulfurimonas sp. F29]|uniref:spermidine synthase n=1 Tax=Thermosulfurimonas sp. F29 TaxID=2867247 RepID=UPI001C829339|nr:hypothetical protein [Thermosulfurimonas sp. F29]MBX6424192.1 hypothetical protein [Thermosulfurimonas sp. F29]